MGYLGTAILIEKDSGWALRIRFEIKCLFSDFIQRGENNNEYAKRSKYTGGVG